jgi:two-component system LytT family response regulator
MLKALIIDDEPANRQLLDSLLQRFCDDITVVDTVDTIEKAVQAIKYHQPQLVFLDVELKGETGFDLFSIYPNPPFDVIFTTAFEKYALKAIKTSCLEYLLKPIDYKELKVAVDKCRQKQALQHKQEHVETLLINLTHQSKSIQKISIPVNDGFVFVHTADILYCEGDNNYTTIHTANSKIVSSKTLKDYDEMLAGNSFFRCHKSYLVNMNHIQKFSRAEGLRLLMPNGNWIDVSVRKKDEFLDLLQKK